MGRLGRDAEGLSNNVNEYDAEVFVRSSGKVEVVIGGRIVIEEVGGEVCKLYGSLLEASISSLSSPLPPSPPPSLPPSSSSSSTPYLRVFFFLVSFF